MMEKKFTYKDMGLSEAINKTMNSLEPNIEVESVSGKCVNGESTIIITIKK